MPKKGKFSVRNDETAPEETAPEPKDSAGDVIPETVDASASGPTPCEFHASEEGGGAHQETCGACVEANESK